MKKRAAKVVLIFMLYNIFFKNFSKKLVFILNL